MLIALVLLTSRADSAALSYDRDVRPILSDACFACHGPDAEKRKASLRLDTAEGAAAETTSGARAIVPGSARESEVIARLLADDADSRTPPVKSGKKLEAAQIAVLQRWIDEGARYEPHWSFVAPVAVPAPDVRDASWPRTVVDRFVLERLEREGLSPEPEADRATLARRAALDLWGLPPPPEDVEALVDDPRPDAYERFVDALLASPRYAENEARLWLDAARYGDTHGYHLDNERALWRWREWVIDALDANVPYDRFALLQLAGDLVPDATLDTRIATGFVRCNPTTGEGGLIAEEYLAKYAMDRVDTFGAVFLGLTVGCAQCHDHKFDPLSQREYYALGAYFGSIAEEASDQNALAPPPFVRAPYPEQEVELARLQSAFDAARARLDGPMPEVDAAQVAWEAERREVLAKRWTAVAPARVSSSGAAEFDVLDDASFVAQGANPPTSVDELEGDFAGVTALRLEALRHASLPLGGAGRAYNANFVLTGVEVDARGRDGAWTKVEIARARADHEQPTFAIAGVLDADPATGWAVSARVEDRVAELALREPVRDASALRVRLRYESKFAQHAIGRARVSIARDPSFTPVSASSWHESAPFRARTSEEAFEREFQDPARIDLAARGEAGEPLWTERAGLTDGVAHELRGDFTAVYLARTLSSPTARRATLALGSDDAIQVWCNGALVHSNAAARSLVVGSDRVPVELRAGANEILVKVVNYTGGFAWSFAIADEEIGGAPLDVSLALAAPANERTSDAAKRVRDHFRSTSSSAWRALRTEADAAQAAHARFESSVPVTMVAADLATPRPARVLVRGQYDHPGDPVEHGVPAVLPSLPPDAPKNRLALARWLVDPAHPLFARVAVNRAWARHFGTGIVATARDFGLQGAYPTHPELLDALAVAFAHGGFDLKRLHKEIVTSSTYRQRSHASAAKLERDPSNALLARGPRFRLDAEVIRDAALCASGLLVERVGGRSVKPYQPEGLWEVVAYPTSNTAKFVADRGDALWRRSVYTFWKRTSPPPSMSAFDAPSREVCALERARTNTPLQALALLSDVQFVEAARALAERAVLEGGPAPSAVVERAFELVLSRAPTEPEQRELEALHADVLARYRASPAEAKALLDVGDSVASSRVDALELAAWTLVASVILNLDEAVTRT